MIFKLNYLFYPASSAYDNSAVFSWTWNFLPYMLSLALCLANGNKSTVLHALCNTNSEEWRKKPLCSREKHTQLQDLEGFTSWIPTKQAQISELTHNYSPYFKYTIVIFLSCSVFPSCDVSSRKAARIALACKASQLLSSLWQQLPFV